MRRPEFEGWGNQSSMQWREAEVNCLLLFSERRKRAQIFGNRTKMRRRYQGEECSLEIQQDKRNRIFRKQSWVQKNRRAFVA
jgi:hypothetical protein